MKTLASNRRARHDYETSDTFEAGVVLTGSEVKSIKSGHISLKGSYVEFRNDEAYLINAHVTAYRFAATALHDETRSRKLLLHKNELTRLLTARQNGSTIIPLRAGIVRGRVKVEIAIARGLKHHDKRQNLKKREAERDISRHAR